jgi:hypothetical protein
MIKVDANSLKNQPLAIDACIILKPLAVTVTASKPKGRSDVPSIPKRISFSVLFYIDHLNRNYQASYRFPKNIPNYGIAA